MEDNTYNSRILGDSDFWPKVVQRNFHNEFHNCSGKERSSMPQLPRAAGKPPPLCVPKAAWHALVQEQLSKYPAPEHQKLLKLVTEFLNQSQTQESQLAYLRTLASVVTKLSAQRGIYKQSVELLQECLLPLALETHFARTAPSEASFRSAIFILISRIHDVFVADESSRLGDYVPSLLESGYNQCLQDLRADLCADAAISQFGAVVLTTLDRPIGKIVIKRKFEPILTLAVDYLAAIIDEATNGDQDEETTSAILHMSNRLSSCTDLLKITASLLKRYPDQMQQMVQDQTSGNATVRKLLQGTVDIAFDDRFLQNNQFMAGYLFPAILTFIMKPADVVQFVLTETVTSTPLDIVLPANFNKWQNDLSLGFSALCVYRGILILLESEPGAAEQTQFKALESLMTFLYKRIIHISDSISESGTRVLAFQTVAAWLSTVTAAIAYTTERDEVAGRTLLDQVISASVVDDIFARVFNCWEDPLDAVQYKLRDVFLNLLEVIHLEQASSQRGQHVQRMVNALMQADKHRKVKYDLLALMLGKVRPAKIMLLRPDFLSQCFEVMTNINIASRTCAFVNRFLKEALSDIPKKDQASPEANAFWLRPVCVALTSDSHVLRKLCSENMTHFLLKQNKHSLPMLLNELNASGQDSTVNSAYRLHATIAIAKAARGLGQIDLSEFLSQNRDMVDSAISHVDPNLRIDVLALLCETRQATADFTQEELLALKRFLLMSMDSQSPDFRQRVQTYLVKLLDRIRRAMYINWREHSSRKEYLDNCQAENRTADNISTMESECKEFLTKLDQKKDFLHWLCKSTVASLFPGCTFQRSNCNLHLMTTILASETFVTDPTARVNLADIPDYPTLATAENVQVLISLISNDTYAPNRELAFELLMQMPASLPGYETLEKVQAVIIQGVEWSGSVRSHESDMGATVAKLMFAKYVVKQGWYLNASNDIHDESRTAGPIPYFIRQLMRLLKHRIDVAKDNLFLSATALPMHGVFRVLQTVLYEVDFGNPAIKECFQEWQLIISEMMGLIRAASDIVLAVCSDESPEGNLPATFADMQQNMEDLVAKAGPNATSDVSTDRGYNAQLILYSCFHTIKESTALLQILMCRTTLPASKEQDTALVKYSQIVEAGDLLRALLASIRHRGAFSAVHVCFSSICTTLLSSHHAHLNLLPKRWLEAFLGQINSVDVSITRRSAGLPLAILAIVSAPVPSRKILLASAMNRLFTIGKEEVPATADERLDLPQVHAYNVIRALIQDANIATEVRDHIGEAFALCIAGFSSSSFPVRNCAAMLFSTLISKSLGTKKARNEMDLVNTVTGREFFTRFPKLHAVLLDNLTFAASFLDQGIVHPALYPILTILARLKPSSVESTDTSMALSAFRTGVMRCASSSITKVREMSARAYCALLHEAELLDTVEELFRKTSFADQNSLHGSLLHIRQLLRIHLEDVDAGVQKEAVQRLALLFQHYSFLATANPCPATVTLFLQIVADNIFKVEWLTSDDIRDDIVVREHLKRVRQHFWTWALESLPDQKQGPILGYAARQMKATLVLLHLDAQVLDAEKKSKILATLLEDSDYEVQLATLSYLKTNLATLTIDRGFMQSTLQRLALGQGNYYQVPQVAASLLLSMKADDVQLDDKLTFAQSLLDLVATKRKPHIVEAFLPLIARQLSLHMNSHKETLSELPTDLIDILRFWSQDEQPLSSREAVLAALQNLRIPELHTSLTDTSIVKLLIIVDRLLEDDDPDVRQEAAELASKVMKLKQPVSSSRCRALLGSYLASQKWSDEARSDIATECCNKVIGEQDDLDRLKMVFGAASDPANDVLFAKEAHNSRHEEIVNMFLAARLLSDLSSSSVQGENHLDRISTWARQALSLLTQSTAAVTTDRAFFGRTEVFTVITRLLVAAHLLDNSSHAVLATQIRTAVTGLGGSLHPGLLAMMCQGGAGWTLVESICLSTST
ncbi:putative death-receptor fusion protein-domain-containing protein [Phlyctochytrium arcticum]|nr:putative death-receptor fusion protein-domain-containing protein [Phlyctochytrium arcticum]